MIDERMVAYTLMDLNHLIREYYDNNLISDTEKTEFLKFSDKLMKIGGLTKKRE